MADDLEIPEETATRQKEVKKKKKKKEKRELERNLNVQTSSVTGYTAGSQMEPFGPGIPHFHRIMFMEPSGSVSGLAKNA